MDTALLWFSACPGRFFLGACHAVDVMLLGHWIEMRSFMGASGALEELVKMMPSELTVSTGKGIRKTYRSLN
jgi:Cu2+-exporting ATPase